MATDGDEGMAAAASSIAWWVQAKAPSHVARRDVQVGVEGGHDFGHRWVR